MGTVETRTDTEAGDAALAAAARAGDNAAYGALFERYHGRIYNYAYGIVGDRDDAGDVAQDAFVKVFQALPRLAGDLDFSAYLYRTAHNAAMDAVKRRSRFAAPEALDFQWDPSLRADPERVALVQEQQHQAWQAAFALSDDHRAILALRELHDFTYQEIADVMDMPRNTVGVLLSRARLKFREAFRMSSLDADDLVKECRDMLPLLSAYIDDELTPAKREKTEAHVRECAFCRLALEEMTESSRSYRALLPLLVPAAFRDEAWAMVEKQVARNAEAAASPAGGAPPAAQGAPAAQEAPAAQGEPATEGLPVAGASSGRARLWSRIAAGAMAVAAIVLLAVSVAGGMESLLEWRATSTTVPTTSAGTGPKAGGPLVAAAGSSSTVSLAASTVPSTTLPSTTGPPTTTDPSTTATTAPRTTTTRRPATSLTTTATAPPTTGRPAASSTTQGGSTTSTAVTPVPIETTTRPPTTVDEKTPPTPSQVSPSPGALVAGGAVKLVWQAVKDPSGVRYTVEVQRYEGSKYVPARTYDGLSSVAVAHTLTAVFERWRVSAVDGAGNRSAPSPWWTYSKKLSLTLPSITIMTTTTIVLY